MKKYFKLVFGKTFSGEQLTENKFLNLIGIQVMRYILAKIFYNLKLLIVSKNKLDNFSDISKKGFVVIENFLDKEEFKKVCSDYEKAINDNDLVIDYKDYGPGVNAKHFYLSDEISKKYPHLFAFYKNLKLQKLFKSWELKENIQMIFKIEHLESKTGDGKDKVKAFHYDTFYNTFKAWYYPKKVDIQDGPLVFAEGTHKISMKRLIAEWKNSISYAFSKDKKNWFGYGSEINKNSHYDKISTKFTVKENTLVFANTHGLHRRGDSIPGTTRDSIHIYSRENPFKIFLN